MSEYISAEQLAASGREEYTKLEGLIARGPLGNKERMAIPQQIMPTGEPKVRARQMAEVALGYTKEQAVVEANRCLQCKNQPCVEGCPVNVHIPEFIAEIAKGEFKKAADVIKQTNLLPAICGRVCPQEKQCQGKCTVGKVYKSAEKAVSIGRLERFVADYERTEGLASAPAIAPASGKKVAVIGSGPAGLTVAADCRRAGHDVTVFEAFHKAGGVMVYGIPEFRLPKSIVANEVENLKKMGVKFEMNCLVGRTATVQQILTEKGFDAAFVGTGAGLPKFFNIPGENYIGVFSANEYLTRANLMKAYEKGKADTPFYEAKTVVVCGGGNVAMDAARMALRLGAEKVFVVYRRTRTEMPARREEVDHAEEEGVEFRFLENPVEILGDAESGKVTAIRALSYELGEPDASGRRSPVAVKGSEHDIPCDAVIVALGNNSNPLIPRTTPEIKTDPKGHITVDESQATSMTKVWAGGDIVLGAATVILAMGEGRKAAASINEYLKKA
ncbi:MAG: NADPH-dependent glutamate synthase [Treponema sp.]|jgi:glutamate synthase (NADPH/NADH) small chain|nr:NADPH-dependent glutamate synthase [Treponema sp.]